MTSLISNGPSHFGAIFLWYDVFMCLVSNHTFCPCLNGVNVLFFLLAICLLANLCAARASSLSLIILFIFSSIEGYFVCVNVVGIAIGDSLYNNSNGVHSRSACRLLLWVNSRIGITFGQSSECEEQ